MHAHIQKHTQASCTHIQDMCIRTQLQCLTTNYYAISKQTSYWMSTNCNVLTPSFDAFNILNLSDISPDNCSYNNSEGKTSCIIQLSHPQQPRPHLTSAPPTQYYSITVVYPTFMHAPNNKKPI